MIRKIVIGFGVLLTFTFSSIGQKLAQTEKQDIVSIIGVGDIMLGSNYPSEAKLPPHDGAQLFRHVIDTLRDANVTFGNLEGCFLNKGGDVKRCKSGCYFFRMPEHYVDYLVDAGFDVLNIANNHMGDFGAPGRKSTVKVLENAGLSYAGLEGVCEVSRFERDGVRYGFCGFAPNSATVRITNIPYAQKLVKELAQDCDIVIVSFHGGAEGAKYNRVPKKTETFYGENRGNVYEFAHAVIDAGADIVFGHGPHVVRAAELYKDRFIIYSMGNFCTAGDFNIRGISGYAPMVKVFTDKEGKFVKGKIISALQLDKKGPVLDAEHLAAKEIKRLTALDFPNTNLSITDDGHISRKKEDLQSTIEVEIEAQDTIINLTQEMAGPTQEVSDLTQNIIDYSIRYLGKPYRMGAVGPKSFDCSGFTSYIFGKFGIDLQHSCRDQITQGEKIDKKDLRKGDLIFFKGRNARSSYVGHVGIVMDNDDEGIKFIHACRRGVIVENLNNSQYYTPRYITGVRIVEEKLF